MDLKQIIIAFAILCLTLPCAGQQFEITFDDQIVEISQAKSPSDGLVFRSCQLAFPGQDKIGVRFTKIYRDGAEEKPLLTAVGVALDRGIGRITKFVKFTVVKSHALSEELVTIEKNFDGFRLRDTAIYQHLHDNIYWQMSTVLDKPEGKDFIDYANELFVLSEKVLKCSEEVSGKVESEAKRLQSEEAINQFADEVLKPMKLFKMKDSIIKLLKRNNLTSPFDDDFFKKGFEEDDFFKRKF